MEASKKTSYKNHFLPFSSHLENITKLRNLREKRVLEKKKKRSKIKHEVGMVLKHLAIIQARGKGFDSPSHIARF